MKQFVVLEDGDRVAINLNEYIKQLFEEDSPPTTALKVYLAEKLLDDKIITTPDDYFRIIQAVLVL